MDNKKIWEDAQKKIQDKVSAISFDLWIKTLEVEDFSNGEFVLAAHSKAAKEQAMNERHFEHIEFELKEAAPIVERVTIIDAIEKEAREATKKGEIIAPVREKHVNRFIPINPLKTFDTFIVGKSNEFVAAAAEAVAKNPGKKVNPLFIYGCSGLGKTHLLHSIANYVSENHPHLRIAFSTCENFLNDYVDSIKNKTISAFRESYRNVDILLIDDVHIIENKTGTQEEFFHTFNDLYQNGKQIVLVSDRHADKFETLEERMRSRFKSGLIQDITVPDVEMRMAILQKKAKLENRKLENEVVEYVASYAFDKTMNVRDMEAMLFKVLFYSDLKGRDHPTVEDCREALQESVEDKQAQTTATSIIESVSKYFNIAKDDIVGKKRNREFVEPRMVAIYLISEFLHLPLVNIGKLLGGRDHTTVMHARNKIASLKKTDARMKRIIEDMTKMILNN
ncbi:MAG: chromosomal replication initiator protein DnaA [Firmicutes bacterium]|nr:chromosomal replication initiator protein DnaA [Bacillota bacterium]